ncbi:MAG: hypothetical protein AUI14_09405 [Actinobacteria bacterium 13_2_20CM_2_71_6]|nr:MAG: hypothetical protein AUI14_09405 [Actinobacteria bacterium 13_2_20CM_2_71_6]
MIIALIVAGLGVDLLARWLRPTPEGLNRYRAFGALAPLLTWTVYIVAAYATSPPLQTPPELGGGHPEAVVELYTGAPLVQALFGLLLAVVLVPGRPAASSTTEAPEPLREPVSLPG